MKNSILTCSLALFTTFTFAQVFEVDTVMWSGPESNRVNMVILSDGYQQGELEQFGTDAASFTASMFSKSPYKEYANYFNVFAVRVPSNESGASHPGTATDVNEPSHPVSIVDNYFGSSFDSFNIHRLLVPANYSAVITVLAQNYPTYDIAFVMVNSPYYGGSGGQFATASLDPSSDEVAIHEIGHSFVNLNDEYYAGDQYASEAINMTQQSDPDLVRWTNWVGDNGIGIYAYGTTGNASNWYRPHQSCKMRVLNSPFCAVCQQGTIERIHSLVSIVDSYSPQNAASIDISETMNFQVDMVNPIPNTLKTSWTLNSNSLAQNVNSVDVDPADLTTGIHQLEVMIQDTIHRLRVDDHEALHFSTITWTLDNTVTGLNDVKREDFRISLFPNPANDILSVQLADKTQEAYIVEIIDIAGRQLITREVVDHSTPTEFDISSLSPGVYVVNFKIGMNTGVSRKVIKN